MNEQWRILLVLPMYGGSLPVGRYCENALRELGHLVETFEAPEFYGAFSALKTLRIGTDRLDYLENSFLQVVSQAILAKVEAFAPDLVLAMAQAPLSRQALKRLQRDKVATAMWFVEDHEVFPYWQAFAPLYSLFAVIQKGAFLDKLAAIGQPNAMYLPLAADPGVHCPMELSPVELKRYGSELSFVGAGYPNRRLAFRQLTGYDLRIWGNDWDGETVLAPFLQRQGERIGTEEMVKIFNATTMNINLHSSVRPGVLVGEGDFVNPRTFELAACGAFQLVDRRTLLPGLFHEDELGLFSTMDELAAALNFYRAHPEKRAEIAQKGRARVLAEHTYVHRMQALLHQARALVSHTRHEVPWLTDLPADLRDHVQALLAKLHLGPQVSFDDLIWAVRSQEGQLDRLETALLFLDEWKKQYTSPRPGTNHAN
ncbi:glycosyltransferase [Desulfovibrionales bacterium]